VERDSKGRFVKGKSGNPNGRPKREVEQDYLQATISSVSLASWKRIVNKAVLQAERGDSAARKWLSDYLLGLPTQNVNMRHKGKVVIWDWKKDSSE
jgi:hypothetical protein